VDGNLASLDIAALDAAMPATIPHMLRERVDQTPEREAFVFFDHGITVSYSELDDQVRRVAGGLLELGVRKGTHVALMMPNVIEFPVTWFAIAWIGAVTVQLNPKFTGRELDYALNDADVDFLVIDAEALSSLEAMEMRSERLPDSNIIVCNDDSGVGAAHVAWETLLACAALSREPRAGVTSDDVIAIIYSSGTTGFPKGCMLDHRYWLQIATSALICQDGHTPRNSLIYEPMFYIQGNAIMIASLLTNATIYCPKRPSISKFFDWVQRYQIDYCAFPVPAVHVMEDYPPEVCASLKWVHAWYFHSDGLQRLEERYDVIARDSYAMTENGVCLYVPVDRPDLAVRGSVGVPAPWREIRIVGDDGNDVADGEIGEVWTAGPGHLHGYYHKTAANRDSFRGKWFRTGDLMRREADGGYYLVGRMKDMIKRSGENISAAEVEGCLSSLPGVLMAAVISVPDAIRGEEVKAYVQLGPGLGRDDLTPSQILAHCAENLAAFKLPRYLAYVDAFPMTAGNDKVSKPKLTEAVEDLTIGAFDRIDKVWR
jgi:acyl-CoA synthetase (AMP-forming)/AMP-acid ligase II